MNLPFNDATNKTGLCQEVDSICGSDTTKYPLVDKARRANMAMSKFVEIALANDTRWQFDDTNNTDLPIGTTNLIAGQNDYSFDNSFLKILKVQCKNEQGDYIDLIPLDVSEVGTPLETLFAESGQPVYYDKYAGSVILYPSPSTSVTNGLKVYYQRDATVFLSTDTTKYPGIPSIFHEYIALCMAEPQLLKNVIDVNSQRKYNNYVSKIEKFEQKIADFYQKRDKDDRKILSAKTIDCQ